MTNELTSLELEAMADTYNATPYHELVDAFLTLCKNAPEYSSPEGVRQNSPEWWAWWNTVRPIRIQLNRRRKMVQA